MATDVRRGFLVGAALVVGLIVGLLVGLSIGPESEVEAPQAKPDSEAPGPTDELNGVPVGYARTEQGAVAAARGYALLTATDVIRDRASFIKAMETIAAPSWIQEARSQASDGFSFLNRRYGDDVDVTAAVLRYDLAEYSPDEATVELWLVSVATGSRRSTVDEVWGTGIVELAWSDGDWRVTHVENTTGPAPLALPAETTNKSAKAVMEELDEFPILGP